MNTSWGRRLGTTKLERRQVKRHSPRVMPMLAALVVAMAFALGAWATVEARSEVPAADNADLSMAPDRTLVNLSGRIQNLVVGCAPSNAALYECGTGDAVALRSLRAIDPSLFGREVNVTGSWADCAGGMGRYFVIESIVPAPCGALTPTPAPTPIVTRDNIALRRPVTASGDVPGEIKEYLTDGDPATNWHAPPAELVYASIDLGYERAFNNFVLRWGESYATRFAIYVWDTRLGEKGDWHRVHHVTDGRGGDVEITIARADSRHILIWMVDSSQPADGFDLREIEVYGVDTPNLALGCQAHVSSAAAGFPSWHANDGNQLTQWASDVGIIPADRNPYIYVRCPTRINISTLRLFWDDVWWPRYYRVAFYQEGRLLPVWFSADNPDGGLDWFSFRSEISIDTALVFVDVKRPGYRGVRLSEFELYGLPPTDMGGAGGASKTGRATSFAPRHGGFRLMGAGSSSRAELSLPGLENIDDLVRGPSVDMALRTDGSASSFELPERSGLPELPEKVPSPIDR